MVRRRRADRISWGFIVFCIILGFGVVITFKWFLDPTLPVFSKTEPNRFLFLVVGPMTLVSWLIFYLHVRDNSGRLAGGKEAEGALMRSKRRRGNRLTNWLFFFFCHVLAAVTVYLGVQFGTGRLGGSSGIFKFLFPWMCCVTLISWAILIFSWADRTPTEKK